MHFIGVDLAWGEKRPSGLAVLDPEGTLLHVSSQGSDETIVAALAPYTSGDCFVAIDAPLVVVNESGNRPCEAALNRDFARFDAGAHPSNVGKPELKGTPRGARLAALLDLDIDPASRSSRRAIEVYPHPATVALFRLGRTLKYKQRSGRQVPELRSELTRLMELLAGLADAPTPLRVSHHSGWQSLVTKVAAAERKSELRLVEDQVDAVVCAYVGLFAARNPSLVTTYGDLATGYIVTPTLPEGHQPSPRTRRVVDEPEAAESGPAPTEPAPTAAAPTEPSSARTAPAVPAAADPVRVAVQQYADRHPELRRTTDQFVAMVTTLLDDAGINYLNVTGRTKSVASFAAKADRTVAGTPVYDDPLTEIADQIGLRVITYLHSDVAAVAELLSDQLVVLDDRDMGEETAREGRFGYASRHLIIALDASRSVPVAYEALRGRSAQVQVRTVLQHAWAEFEHAIRYKGTIPDEHVPDLDRRFTLAAGLLELADREFTAIRDRLQTAIPEERRDSDTSDPRISAEELATFLAGQYVDAGWSRTDHYEWVSGLLLELGITSPDELSALLTSVDSDALSARMGYRYPAGAVRRLDDALLAVFGDRYVELHGNAHRVPLLRARLEKLRSPDLDG